MSKPSGSDIDGRKVGLAGIVGSVGMRLRTRGGWDDQGGSKDKRTRESKGGSTEESGSEEHISGKVQEPGRTRNVGRGFVDGFFDGIDLTACGRLAPNQLEHACAGNPVPFRKVPDQGSQAGNLIEQATF